MTVNPRFSGFAIGLAAGVAWLAASVGVQATPLDPALVATGSLTFDDGTPVGFSFADPGVVHGGGMTVKEGGADTTVGFAGDTVGSPNPLTGSFTDALDGLGIDASIDTDSTADPAEFGLGIDLALDVTNSSSTDTIKVTVTIEFSNTVETGGLDAFAHSEFTLDEVPGGEFFFTDILSDSAFGNEVAGDLTGDFGGLVTDAGMVSFDFTLLPTESLSITGALTVEGGIFDTGFASAAFSAFLSLSDMNITGGPPPPPTGQVPEPGALSLLATGLIGLGLARRRRRRR